MTNEEYLRQVIKESVQEVIQEVLIYNKSTPKAVSQIDKQTMQILQDIKKAMNEASKQIFQSNVKYNSSKLIRKPAKVRAIDTSNMTMSNTYRFVLSLPSESFALNNLGYQYQADVVRLLVAQKAIQNAILTSNEGTIGIDVKLNGKPNPANNGQ